MTQAHPLPNTEAMPKEAKMTTSIHNAPVTLTVILKDAERSYRQKFLIYEAITLVHTDQTIIDCVKEAKVNFQGDPEEYQIRASFEL